MTSHNENRIRAFENGDKTFLGDNCPECGTNKYFTQAQSCTQCVVNKRIAKQGKSTEDWVRLAVEQAKTNLKLQRWI